MIEKGKCGRCGREDEVFVVGNLCRYCLGEELEELEIRGRCEGCGDEEVVLTEGPLGRLVCVSCYKTVMELVRDVLEIGEEDE